MASSPPPGGPKRKHGGSTIREGIKRFKSHLHPLPSDDGSSSDSPAVAGIASPDRSPNPEPPITTSLVASEQAALPYRASTGLSAAGSDFTDVASANSSTATRLKQVATSGLESALRALHISAGVIPPLKPAISDLVECLDIIQGATATAKEYEALTSELKVVAHNLNEYLSELGPEYPNGNTSCARIALSIETEVARIKDRQAHSKIRRAIDSAEEREDVIQQYRRVEALFLQLQHDISLQTLRNVNKQHVAYLLRGMCPVDDARYNSSYSTTVKRQACTKETREQVQMELQNWTQDPKGAKVYWMNGMAGTGKTTIAYSLCEYLNGKQQLGGSFFCSRVSASCRNVTSIIPTIAYQLAHYSLAFRASLGKILEVDPEAGKLNVARQFEKLIRDPMIAAKDNMLKGVVVVIDALDECENDQDVQQILDALLRLGTNLPLKFFVTSRPDPVIREKMLSPTGYSPSVLHLHDIEQSIVEEDIRKYLAEALSPMSPSPSPEEVEQLAKLAGKLFIYAATVTRYIIPGKAAANSVNRLKSILTDPLITDNQGSNKRYKQLDELYNTVLAAAFDDEELEGDEIESMRLVLWTVVCAKEPMEISIIASLLHLTESQVSAVLQPLRSVIHFSEASELVTTLHASFPEYMLDQSRSGKNSCNHVLHSELLAHAAFDTMQTQLRFNICNLDSSFDFDKDVPDLKQRIQDNISPALFYSCLYWGEHLRLGGPSEELHGKLADFLTYQLLFWVEVLNLRQCAVKSISILSRAKEWLPTSSRSGNHRQQATDAIDFVTRFAAGACSRSTPHLYISSLPFCAKSSSVYIHYWGRTRGLIDILGTARSHGKGAAQATWMTGSSVNSLGISTDGARIISGHADGSIYVRDAHTGDVMVGPFQGHKGPVHSVALSPDGAHIVSGSGDHSIRVWDGSTGNVVAGPFNVYESSVNSVAFSPNGTYIISGSREGSIHLRDARTGVVEVGIEELRGRLGSVYSVAFSPDGTYFVFGSGNNHSIGLWDGRTGTITDRQFRGHTGLVKSISFSPDGTLIVSGSSDRTVRVWDTSTKFAAAEPFQGHTEPVNSVAFSPDGAYIVSGSDDCTIRVWDAHTGDTTAGPFEGHIESISSVAFLPDGAHIVSGSRDKTIRVWDARTSDIPVRPSQGHTGSIKSVAFSPDGAYIVTGSDNCMVGIWDAHTGNVVRQLQGHSSSIYSVSISSDRRYIVSGSWDKTIMVWKTRTGEAVVGPLQGHTGSVKSVAFSPDGAYIVSGSGDCTIRVWERRTGNATTGKFRGHTGSVNSVAFSPNGAYIVSGSDDCTLRLWDSRTGDVAVGPLTGHKDSVYSVIFSPDGTRMVSGSGDKTVRIWGVDANGLTVKVFEGHTDPVSSVAFSPNGAYVASGSWDKTVRVWDAHTGSNVAGPFQAHTDWVNSVAFSPDGTRVVSGSRDQVIRVWDFLSHAADPQSNNDGWLTNDRKLLFWASIDLHPHVPHPRNTLLIGPQGTAFIDYKDLLLGDKWSETYIQ